MSYALRNKENGILGNARIWCLNITVLPTIFHTKYKINKL